MATVSYVVNGGPKRVTDETATRVRRAIEELGYRPDPIARQLRGVESSVVGLLVPNFHGPFFADLAAELECQARERGMLLLVGSTNLNSELEMQLVNDFRDRRVKAILSIGPTPGLIPDSASDGMSHGALTVLPAGGVESAVAVGIHQRNAARDAVEHLLGHGRRHIGVILGPSWCTVFTPRLDGWREAVGLTPEEVERWSLRANYSFEGGYGAAAELVERVGEGIDAIFVSNDTQAVGALAALHELGLRVPEDIAVVSIDAAEMSAFLTPALTSVEQPAKLLASTALDVVEGKRAGGSGLVLVPHELVVRRSCGCNPQPVGEGVRA